MSDDLVYPAVPLVSRDEVLQVVVTADPRTGAITAEVAGRTFTARPAAGQRRTLDASFLDLRRQLRRAGYRLQSCGTCQQFRYGGSSRAMSAGLSGYCGLGVNELAGIGLGSAITGQQRAPVVTLLYSCPAWVGRDERELADFFRTA